MCPVDQPNSERSDATLLEEKAAKVKAIIESAIAKVESTPKRTPEEIWEEFDAVWDRIASQG